MVMQLSSTSSFSLISRYANLSPIFPPFEINRFKGCQFRIISSHRIRQVVVRNSNQTAEVTCSDSVTELGSASSVIRKFYAGINSRDLESVEQLIAENCVYEDLVFPQPFVGRKAILQFFKMFTDSVGSDLQFVIDDISDGDSSVVGVTWHLEWRGRPFPFSRGCSFYRLEVVNGQRQILYGRDSVEPAVKPGEMALGGQYMASLTSLHCSNICMIRASSESLFSHIGRHTQCFLTLLYSLSQSSEAQNGKGLPSEA